MERIRFGAIHPEGDLRNRLQADMDGCIGHLEELAPAIVCQQEIYGRDRLTRLSRQAELGRKPDEHTEFEGTGTDVQFMWWNSESQSNWRDGYVRSVLLLQDPALRRKVDQYVDSILATQDADGYLGIYGQDLRYRHTTENGELWSKSTLYRVLLAYYEYTGKERVLTALKRAFENLMAGYPLGQCDPFRVEKSFAGHCHGLTITDALYEMYELTGEEKYLTYALWLYERYSANQVEEEDMKSTSLRDPLYLWKNHGVHLYEHMRPVILAASYDPHSRDLLYRMQTRLPYYLTPSGGPIGDEWVNRRAADATRTGYEFCSVTELFDSYALLLQKTGDLSIGDQMEWLYYNAGLGMKHPEEGSIMYCKTDNCYTADRQRNPEDVFVDERYKYSPVHQTTAVCCVPNMGRLNPHYVQNLFAKEEDGFTAVLFGDCRLEDTFRNVPVTIRQKTAYPADLSLTFEVTAASRVSFALRIRLPKWATGFTCDLPVQQEAGCLLCQREWQGATRFTVRFDTVIRVRSDLRRDWYITRGPLVYALPIAADETTLLAYETAPFREVAYRSRERWKETLKIHENDRDHFSYTPSPDGDWRHQSITGPFWDGETFRELTLQPMGGTILRKVTFPIGLGS